MKRSLLSSIGALGIALAFISLASAPVAGQTAAKSSAAPKVYTPPRTGDGQPDLQGVWDYRTVTPLERPADLAGKETLTEQEIADYEKQRTATLDKDRRDGGAAADVQRAYNEFWWDYGKKVVGHQTSLVVDPPDGKIPYTPEGQKRGNARAVFQAATAREEGGVGRGFDSWLDRPFGERCILWGVAGPPMMPGAYNNNVQLFQSRDYVVIYNEMIHEHRMVPLDGRPHVSNDIRMLQGDSRGHWEGNTLVVDTTNFTNRTSFRGATENLHLTERFTRTAPDTLIYEYTVDDPTTFTKPWTARVPMAKNPDFVYEYACHEGNYALPHGLEGERNIEKAAAAAAKSGSR
jgi:hypothetical protein